MTPWHYGELKRRLYLLRGSFAKRARGQGDNHQTVQQYRDEDERYIHLESDQSPADQFKRALDRASPQTRRDALRFVEITKDYTAALRFLSARALAPRLVEDPSSSPLEQLKWLYSDVMAQVGNFLSFRFEPKDNGRDFDELNALIDAWLDILKTRHRQRAKKGRMDSDAKSIAYVHWIARHRLTRHERIVLVTGDAPLYEAYCSWHAEQPLGEAFLLRRVNQFAPLINPHDMPNDIRAGEKGGYQLFDSIRRAMEAPLLPINLARKVDGRAHLANILKSFPAPENDPLVQDFTPQPVRRLVARTPSHFRRAARPVARGRTYEHWCQPARARAPTGTA